MPPEQIIALGFVLVLLGFLVPFFMLLGFIESTFFLNFTAYGASIVGLFMGFYGGAMIVRRNRKRDQ